MLLYEGEDVARLTAHEALVTAPQCDGEVVVLPVVEGTRPSEAVTDALELHVLADDRDDVRLFAYALDDVVGNHAKSATVTPFPPSFQAPSLKPFTLVSLRSISPTRSRNTPVPFP